MRTQQLPFVCPGTWIISRLIPPNSKTCPPESSSKAAVLTLEEGAAQVLALREQGMTLKDAAREVRALARQGCHVGAIFMGPSLNIPSAETIYGKSLARIHTLDQLASAAGRLIQAEIQELE